MHIRQIIENLPTRRGPTALLDVQREGGEVDGASGRGRDLDRAGPPSGGKSTGFE